MENAKENQLKKGIYFVESYKRYSDLNLKAIREAMDLDFAHFTYQRGMCSCCYSPLDLPKRYWRNQEIPTDKHNYEGGIRVYNGESDEVMANEYTYLLFKNADNGSGCVKRNDPIKDYTCIEWAFPMSKLDAVCKMLQEQLGEEYEVQKPKDYFTCIIIHKKKVKR